MEEMIPHYERLLRSLPVILFSVFTAILFLQSGLDKVFNFQDNMDWLKGHFSKTFLAPMTPVMVVTITALEAVTGVGTVIGLIYFFTSGSAALICLMSLLGALTLLALFFGQRVAKDYAGAAVLVPYFILQVILVAVAAQDVLSRFNYHAP